MKYSPISDSILAVNTIDGTLLYNIKSRSFNHILPSIKISNVYLDREQNLWIGTQVFQLAGQTLRSNCCADQRIFTCRDFHKRKIFVC